MSFSELGIQDALVHAARQYATPTPVQTATIPLILEGRDVRVVAPTGSGKTTAFVLPLLQRWLAHPRTKREGVHTLILVPTRELAAQVREVIQQFSRELPERIKAVSAVGGVSINPQMMALRGGADFIVATPGRLLDLVEKNAVTLTHVTALVLDEADRMLDLGFADEMQRLFALLPAQRHNLMFSATFPKAVQAIAAEVLNDPAHIEIESVASDAPAITQRAIRVDSNKKGPLLRHLIILEEWERVLVFVARQYTAEHVADKLRTNGIEAQAFHGDVGQGSRGSMLEAFKQGTIQVLVATDLAARGLDIVDLPVVLNYDLPRSTVDYTHRIGRTGRAGESGQAISFVTADAEAHFHLIEKRQRQRIAREEIEGFEVTERPPAPAPGGGGVKGLRPSKKDKLREAAAREEFRIPKPKNEDR